MATLGVLILLNGIAVIRYGARVTFVDSELPTTLVHPFGKAVSIDRFILLGIAAALSVGLWALYRYTKFGLATTAAAENQRAASTVGISPDRIAVLNWSLGSGLAGLAAILVSPIVTLQVSTMTNLVLAAMAAALGRRVPVVPDRVRRRSGHRGRPDRADELRFDARRARVAALRDHHPGDDLPGAGAADPRSLPAEAARRRYRADQVVAGCRWSDRWRSG